MATCKCDPARVAENEARRAAYRAEWPQHCQTCEGWGGAYWYGNRDEPGGWDPCPDCLEKGKCPRCGAAGPEDEDWWAQPSGCPACGWTEDDGTEKHRQTDGMEPGWVCECGWGDDEAANAPRPLPQPRVVVEPTPDSDAPWTERRTRHEWAVQLTYRNGETITFRSGMGFLPSVNLAVGVLVDASGQTSAGDVVRAEVLEVERVIRQRVRFAAEYGTPDGA